MAHARRARVLCRTKAQIRRQAVWPLHSTEIFSILVFLGHHAFRRLWVSSPSTNSLCATRDLASARPDTATGLPSALTEDALAVQGSAEYNTLTFTLSILIGVFSFFRHHAHGLAGRLRFHAGYGGLIQDRDVRRHADAITFPGLLIWRVGGDLFLRASAKCECRWPRFDHG